MIKKVVVIPDLHLPYEDKRSVAAVEKYLATQEWDEIIYLGDLIDFDAISSHNATNLRAVEGKTINGDYAYTNDFLDRQRNILGNTTKMTLLEGNHDYRIERYIDCNPRLRGSLEVDRCLHLKDRGINWVRSWRDGVVYRIGKAGFIHGLYTNDQHSKQHVSKYGENIFYGHLHDVQLYSLTRNGDNKTIVGQSLGCLCDYRPYWMRGRPNRWQQAITVFHFFPDGHFSYAVTQIFKHRFIIDGKEYKG